MSGPDDRDVGEAAGAPKTPKAVIRPVLLSQDEVNALLAAVAGQEEDAPVEGVVDLFAADEPAGGEPVITEEPSNAVTEVAAAEGGDPALTIPGEPAADKLEVVNPFADAGLEEVEVATEGGGKRGKITGDDEFGEDLKEAAADLDKDEKIRLLEEEIRTWKRLAIDLENEAAALQSSLGKSEVDRRYAESKEGQAKTNEAETRIALKKAERDLENARKLTERLQFGLNKTESKLNMLEKSPTTVTTRTATSRKVAAVLLAAGVMVGGLTGYFLGKRAAKPKPFDCTAIVEITSDKVATVTGFKGEDCETPKLMGRTSGGIEFYQQGDEFIAVPIPN